MKGIGTLMLIIAPELSILANPLTPDQALRRIQGSTTMSRIPGNAISIELSHTENADGIPMLYVFNRGEQGFVIASADDALPAILGYSDSGAFNPANASPELKWWLGQYADEASCYLNENATVPVQSTKRNAARANRPGIPEMLTTKWNQDAPYNLSCPVDGNKKSVTGCVATAMAQVIKYHGYPSQGSGEHSYDWNGQPLSFDYGNTTFNYAEMLDDYKMMDSSEAQQRAVAELMYACGVSVNMDYSAGDSGAGDIYIPYALRTFFNYDAGTRILKRTCFSTEEWEDIVYSELAENRPVIYGGQAPDGGHEFVCDGYDNGYFHINWGWSGMGDGYFLLSALDPGLQGIGGFSGGYNADQAIVCGAKPSQDGGSMWYPIYATGSMAVTEVNPGFSQLILKFQNGGMYNYSPEGATLSFFLKAVSESGEEYLVDTPLGLTFGGAVGLNVSGYTGFSIRYPSGLAAGNYKVYLVFQTPEGKWQDVKFPLTAASYLDLTVDADGKYSFKQGVPVLRSKIKVTAFSPDTAVLSGVATNFDLTVENIGEVEFSGNVTLKVYEKDSRIQSLAENRIQFILAAGEVYNGYVNLTYDLPEGEYDAIFYDQYDDEVSDVFALKIGAVPIGVERIILDSTDTKVEVNGTLQLKATVLPEEASDKSIIWSSSNPEVANVDQTGLVTAFTPGTTLITVKSAANEDISVSCMITVTEKAKVIYVGSIILDPAEVAAVPGTVITITATVMPEDATDKSLIWTSSDEAVATVADGVVTVQGEGNAVITASAIDGSEIKAECHVSGISWVDAIENDGAEADVYTVNGMLIKKNADMKFISKLAKGTYIIRIGNVARKIMR